MLAPKMLKFNIFSFITMQCTGLLRTAELVKASSSPTKFAPPKQPSIFGYTLSFPSPIPTIPFAGKNQLREGKIISVF